MLSQEIIDFERNFEGDNIFQDVETATKILLSVRHHYHPEDIIGIIDAIFTKISRYSTGRNWITMPTKEYNTRLELVRQGKKYVEEKIIHIDKVLPLLFTLEEMEIYGY